jgi:hypothetical protein
MSYENTNPFEESKPVPTADMLLEAPYEGDDIFMFERRLAEQINNAPAEQRWDLTAFAKERIKAHYPEHIGRLLFATTHLAISLQPSVDDESLKSAFAYHNATVSGEIKRIDVLSLSDERHHVVFELQGALVLYIDGTTGTPGACETDSPVFVPIGAITSHELF